ncbi:MAG: YbaK/EbsC family protein [Microgenomates group bacterium]
MTSGGKKFKEKIKKLGISLKIICLPKSTGTAMEAAWAVGCQLGQIAKSIVFKTGSGKPILVITSGANRVDEKKLAKILGEEVQKADADFVKEKTGFAVGGVPPFGHKQKISTFIDKDLFKFSEIWAAAGDPFSVFKTTGEELQKISGGKVMKIKQTA